ncbi:MAG: xanthine dehydrogenase family protein subunit M [Gemmatimonadota bacterium]|nr:xanthine dehydrogenase family protein subunit M [Gemmatimonadota bacterium]
MMRLPTFVYHAPRSVEEAVEVKRDAPPEAMYVAGGTDLYPNMKRRHQDPPELIALHAVEGLGGIEPAADGGLSIGATTTLTEIARDRRVREACPALAETMRLISTPILQNMGTIGGNLLLDTRCTYYDQNHDWRESIDFCMKKDGEICWVAPASPRCWAVQSADSVPLLIAIGATVDLVGPDGERTVPVSALYRDDGIVYLKKKRDELLTRVNLPASNGWRAVYRKVRRRGAFDFPVVGVGARVDVDEDGGVTDARVVLGGVGSAPIEVEGAAETLVEGGLQEEPIDAVVKAAWKAGRPLDNTDFTLSWRKQMIRPTVRRALEALGRGEEGAAG